MTTVLIDRPETQETPAAELSIARPIPIRNPPPPPTVQIPYVYFISPQPNDIVAPGSTLQIHWQVSSVSQQILRVKQVGGAGLLTLAQYGPSGTQTDFQYPLQITSTFPFRDAAIQLDVTGTSGTSLTAYSGTFHVDAGPAQGGGATSFTSPSGGELWSCNQVQIVTWTYNGATPQRFEIAYSLGTGPFQTVNNNISGLDRTYYFFPPYVSTSAQARLRLRTVGTDGSLQDAISNPFTLINA